MTQKFLDKLLNLLENTEMSAIDEVLFSNKLFSTNLPDQHLSTKPARKLAVIACMDYRLPILDALGLHNGDAVVIRNAGGIVTEDVLRSLIVAHYLLEVEELMIINHTECGMLTFHEQDFIERLEKETGYMAVIPAHFYSFENLEENVVRQYRRLKSHPWIPNDFIIRGFIYDVHDGALSEVTLK